MLFPRIVHEGSLILYFANETNGRAADGEVFNETVYFAAGVEADAANETILNTVQTQLEAGANPGLGLTALHVVLHEMLGAIYAYE
ncbi:hypothetical protein WJX73_000495 [Symbiochloris irregularis]|uniref:Uncharacterized protein n=1 Tax=Symbiochloris irregularis TaxID=706552 RepID=A0AAW1NPV5_9CHLO